MKFKRGNRRATTEPLERRVMLAAVPVGEEFRVNTYTSNPQGGASVAIDGDGDFVVVWESSEQDGAGWGVYGQRFTADGVPAGDEFPVNEQPAGDQRSPWIAMDAGGNFVVVFTSPDGGGGFGDGGIFGQRFNADGVPQGDHFRVNETTAGSQLSPNVAMSPDGDFIVAWSSYQNGTDADIYARRFASEGTPLGGEFLVNANTSQQQLAPKVAIGPSNRFAVTWNGWSDASSNDVYLRRFNAVGTPLAPELRVNTYTFGNQVNPSILIRDDESIVVTWTSLAQPTLFDSGVYAQLFDSTGLPQGSEFIVNSFTTGDQVNPHIASLPGEEFVITWNGQGSGDSAGVFAQRFDAGADRRGAEFRVNTHTAGSQGLPRIASQPNGEFLIAWSGETAGDVNGVAARRFAVVPTVDTSHFQFTAAPHHIDFGFDEEVGGSLSAKDLVLENLSTGLVIPATDLSLVYDAALRTASFRYTGSGSGINGVFGDGNYRATLLADGITTPGGIPIAADHVFDFFFLNGDANRDGNVNLEDFNILASNFGQTGRDFTQGNFDYDPAGNVNLNDFNILASRFGVVLGPPPSTQATWWNSTDDEPGEKTARLEI